MAHRHHHRPDLHNRSIRSCSEPPTSAAWTLASRLRRQHSGSYYSVVLGARATHKALAWRSGTRDRLSPIGTGATQAAREHINAACPAGIILSIHRTVTSERRSTSSHRLRRPNHMNAVRLTYLWLPGTGPAWVYGGSVRWVGGFVSVGALLASCGVE